MNTNTASLGYALFALTLLAATPGCDPDDPTFRAISSAGDTGGDTGSDTGGLAETGTGDGDGDCLIGSTQCIEPSIICGCGEYAYIEYNTWCKSGFGVVCGYGAYLTDGTSAVCCIGDECSLMPFEQGCPEGQVHVCDTP
jgi:hypothetical protein